MDKRFDGADVFIEIEQISGLMAAAGAEGAREIFNAFWRSTEELLTALEAHIDAGDLDEAAKCVHAIKGSAANVGAAGLAQSAAGLEVACNDGDPAVAKAMIDALRTDFNAARTWLDAHLRQAG